MHRLRHGRRDVDALQVVPVAAIVATDHLHAAGLTTQAELTLLRLRRSPVPVTSSIAALTDSRTIINFSVKVLSVFKSP